jgi:hypothetical protein
VSSSKVDDAAGESRDGEARCCCPVVTSSIGPVRAALVGAERERGDDDVVGDASESALHGGDMLAGRKVDLGAHDSSCAPGATETMDRPFTSWSLRPGHRAWSTRWPRCGSR